MNYYNPYFYTNPTVSMSRTGLFSRLFSNFSFSKLLNSTQKALSFANQAIPFVKQVKPIIGNAKTIFKVMNEFKRAESQNNTTTNIKPNKYERNDSIKSNDDNGPTFFI